MSTITAAILAALVYWIVYTADLALSWQCLNRPIVIAPIVGLVLGDVHTGIVMGASLEAIFMGISAIGGSIPSDPSSASVIAVTYTILTGATVETGLALALPIGTLMASLGGIMMTVWSSLAPYWERLAASGKNKSFVIQTFLVSVLMAVPSVLVIFFGLAFGAEGLNNLLSALPAWVMTGVGAASSMMIGVGFAILTSMIWSKNVGYFFFVGYVLTKVMNLGSLYVAILGAAIAITMFMNDKQLIELKNSLKAVPANANTGNEEGFF